MASVPAPVPDVAEYIATRFTPQVQWYDRRAAHNQFWHRVCKFVLVLFGALTPVTATIHLIFTNPNQGFWHTVGEYGPLVASILAGGFALADKSFGFQDLWIRYRNACEDMQAEYEMYKHRVGEAYKGEDAGSSFVSRAEHIMQQERRGWPEIASRRIEMHG
jgi:hypothetical protein